MANNSETNYNIKKINSFYQSTVCHICKSFSTILKRCSSCKLYAYCSKSHQQLHWKSHKELCKLVNSLLTKNYNNKKHIFDIKGISQKPYEEWQKMKVELKFLWEGLLNRTLTDSENQLWMFPRVCEICRISQQDLLYDCATCYSVSYCSVAHEKSYEKYHQNYCQSLKLCFEINCHLFHNEIYELPVPKINSNLKALPANTDTFVRECTRNVEDSIFAQVMAGDNLSPILTIINTLQLTGFLTKRQFCKNSCVFHIIGASTYEQNFSWKTFAEFLFHWMLNVTEIAVILVGPELMVDNNWCEQVNSEMQLLCSDCDDKKCKIMVERCFYHDYVIHKSFIDPDLVVALNCGLHEYQQDQQQGKDSWSKSIPSMLSYVNVPLLLTAYTFQEAQMDFQRLLAAHGTISKINSSDRHFDALIRCQRNQFRSLRPLRDWDTCDIPVFYQNNYVTVIKIT